MINLTLITSGEKQELDEILSDMKSYAWEIEDSTVRKEIMNFYNKISNILDSENEICFH